MVIRVHGTCCKVCSILMYRDFLKVLYTTLQNLIAKIRLRHALGQCYDTNLTNAGHPAVLGVDTGNGPWQGTTGSH